YDLAYVFHPTLTNFVLPLLGVLAIVVALLWAARRSRIAAQAALWLFLPLLPALAAIGVFGAGELVHDRYLYLPSIGFSILLALVIVRLPASATELFGLPASRAAACFALAGVLAARTAQQTVHWASNLLLYHYS